MRSTTAMTPAERAARALDDLIVQRQRIDYQIREALRIVDNQPITRRKRSRHELPECGTESAYQRHRHYGEDQDEACKEAHRLHNRVQYARKTYGDTIADLVQTRAMAS